MRAFNLNGVARSVLAALLLLLSTTHVYAAEGDVDHEFELTIDDTIIDLVGDMTYHTFAFNGQVPGPLIHVKEGERIRVNVTNFTTLTHTIHWHGMIQRGSWQSDGVPDKTQKPIKPGDTFTYEFVAEPSGTHWYHCHVNVNEHVAIRGMWGAFIVEPKEPTEIEQKVTKDYVLMLSSWASKWAHSPGEGGVPGDVFDYFTINGKAFPESQAIRVEEGDVVRLRLIGAGEEVHSVHIHGHVFDIAFKDGHALPHPIKADTVLMGPGERYDLILYADNPGRWMIHDHVDTHTMNADRPDGGIMTVIEYREIDHDDEYYHWGHKEFQADFYFEEALQKPHGMHETSIHRGEPAL